MHSLCNQFHLSVHFPSVCPWAISLPSHLTYDLDFGLKADIDLDLDPSSNGIEGQDVMVKGVKYRFAIGTTPSA